MLIDEEIQPLYYKRLEIKQLNKERLKLIKEIKQTLNSRYRQSLIEDLENIEYDIQFWKEHLKRIIV